MRKSLLACVMLTLCSILPVSASAELRLNGTASGALTRYSYTDAYGTANSITPLNLGLNAYMPFAQERLLNLNLATEETQLVTPVRENKGGIGFTQGLLPIFGKQGQFKLGYNFRTYNDQVNTETNFNSHNLAMVSNLNLTDICNLRLNYDFYNKIADDDPRSYKDNDLRLGTDLKLRDMRDTLNIDYDYFSQDAETKAASFKWNTLDGLYTYSLGGSDSLEGSLHWRNVTYDNISKTNNRKELEVGAAYNTASVGGTSRWNGSIYNESYPHADINDFSLYELGFKNFVLDSKKWRSAGNYHKVNILSAKKDTENGYLEWLWGLDRHTAMVGNRSMYLDNNLKLKYWSNGDKVVSKGQDFLEDIVDAGWEWSSFSYGSFAVGPQLGHRFYRDPNADSNAVDSDNSIFKNPANFLLYGVRVTSGLVVTREVMLNLAYNYRMFLYYEAKPNKFTTELSDVRLQYRQDVTNFLTLSCDVAYADNVNDNGLGSIGVSKMFAQLQLVYKFNQIFN
jgi:hypothetical protein